MSIAFFFRRKIIRRMLKGKTPHADFDPHAVNVFQAQDHPCFSGFNHLSPKSKCLTP
ncbi:hypothetical protein Hanom_Chr15g01398171 [Helianthus anomalus]